MQYIITTKQRKQRKRVVPQRQSELKKSSSSATVGSVTDNNQVSKEDGKDQESIQSNITPNPGHHMGK